MLGIKGIDTEERSFIPSFISYGINKVMITSVDVVELANACYSIVFSLETPEIKDPNFKHPDGRKGQTGRASVFLNSKDPESFKKINRIVGLIADKLEVKPAVEAITNSDVNGYFAALSGILQKTGPAWFVLSGREYKPGKYSLSFPLFRFCKKVSEVDEDTIVMENNRITFIKATNGQDLVWDKNSKYHFMPYQQPKPTDDTELNPFGKTTSEDIKRASEAKSPSFLEDDSSDDLPFGMSE